MLSGNAANAAAPETCHRTLTNAMTKDIGVETAQFIKTAYIPNQLRTVFDAQGSERDAVAKETASVFAETVISAAIDESVPVPVLSAALFERFTSRGEADFANKLMSAMRYEFGGHLEKEAEGKA